MAKTILRCQPHTSTNPLYPQGRSCTHLKTDGYRARVSKGRRVIVKKRWCPKELRLPKWLKKNDGIDGYSHQKMPHTLGCSTPLTFRKPWCICKNTSFVTFPNLMPSILYEENEEEHKRDLHYGAPDHYRGIQVCIQALWSSPFNS